LADLSLPWRISLRIFPGYPLYETTAEFPYTAALADAAPRCLFLLALGAALLAKRQPGGVGQP
jgi:hypothetical protein